MSPCGPIRLQETSIKRTKSICQNNCQLFNAPLLSLYVITERKKKPRATARGSVTSTTPHARWARDASAHTGPAGETPVITLDTLMSNSGARGRHSRSVFLRSVFIPHVFVYSGCNPSHSSIV